MNYNTFNRYFYTADYWSWTIDSTDNNAQRVYAYDRTIKLKVVADGTGRLLINTDEQLMLNGRIRNIRDKGGNLILEVTGFASGREYEITQAEPVLNPAGYRQGLRYWSVEVS